jgi:hypothetical protein
MPRITVFIIMSLALFSTVSAQDTAVAEPSLTFADEILVVRAMLDSNGFTDMATTDLCKAENNRMVVLDFTNKKAGTTGITRLMPSIGRLTALKELRLANNSLTTLPDELANCKSLVFLDIGSNQMTALPQVIGKLSSLEKLDIRYNGLTEFPEVVLELNNLWYLQMWGNYLTGLPESLGKLTKLKELYLKDNRLAMLPHSITKMKSLTYIDYNYNRICQPDPDVDAWFKKKDKDYKETQKCW